jgi:hypothetical protein
MKRSIIPLIAIVFVCVSAEAGGAAAHSLLSKQHVTATVASPLVGRWSRVHRCQELVNALKAAGLGSTAPSAVGDFFPGSTSKQLAKKPDPCEGAKPMVHSHFFAGNGTFGSLDQNSNQVDDGRYRIVDVHTLRIGTSTFHYRILSNRTLRLNPVITAAARRQALAHPLQFSTAVWMVSVAYPGHSWKPAPCNGWC